MKKDIKIICDQRVSITFKKISFIVELNSYGQHKKKMKVTKMKIIKINVWSYKKYIKIML